LEHYHNTNLLDDDDDNDGGDDTDMTQHGKVASGCRNNCFNSRHPDINAKYFFAFFLHMYDRDAILVSV
jgi:hypothetical protein